MLIPLKDVASKLQHPPTPDFSAVGVTKIKSGVKYKLSDVKSFSLQENTARLSTGTVNEEVEALRASIFKGWQSHQYLPAVYRNADGVLCLVYGYNRVQILEELFGADFEFLFDELVDCDNTNIREVRLIENEGLPAAYNSEKNIIASVIDKIQKDGFKVEDTESYLKNLFPHRPQKSISRMVGRIEESQNYEKQVIQYTLGKFNQWVREYSSVAYTLTKGNNKDKPHNGHYIFLAKNGYQYRSILRGSIKYISTKLPMAIIGHVDLPSEGQTLTDKRIEYINSLDNTKKVYQTLGADMSFVKLLGFLPQDTDSENLSKLITVKEVYAQKAKETKLKKVS